MRSISKKKTGGRGGQAGGGLSFWHFKREGQGDWRTHARTVARRSITTLCVCYRLVVSSYVSCIHKIPPPSHAHSPPHTHTHTGCLILCLCAVSRLPILIQFCNLTGRVTRQHAFGIWRVVRRRISVAPLSSSSIALVAMVTPSSPPRMSPLWIGMYLSLLPWLFLNFLGILYTLSVLSYAV